MAATPKNPPAKKTETPAPALPFVIRDNVPLPPRARIGGGEGSVYNAAFDAMKPGQSFIVPVAVPATITDEKERAKAFKEEARKITNRLSGAIRRYKKDHPDRNLAVRTVDGEGVGVWAEADSKA